MFLPPNRRVCDRQDISSRISGDISRHKQHTEALGELTQVAGPWTCPRLTATSAPLPPTPLTGLNTPPLAPLPTGSPPVIRLSLGWANCSQSVPSFLKHFSRASQVPGPSGVPALRPAVPAEPASGGGTAVQDRHGPELQACDGTLVGARMARCPQRGRGVRRASCSRMRVVC